MEESEIGVGGTDWERDGLRGVGDEFDRRGRNVYRVPHAGQRDRDDGEGGECDLHGGTLAGYAAAIGAARKDLAKESRELVKTLMVVSAIGGDRRSIAASNPAYVVPAGGADTAGRGNDPVRFGAVGECGDWTQ